MIDLQKLEGLVAVLAPRQNPQRDVSTMENILVKHCAKELKAKSAFGQLIRGPQASDRSDADWKFSAAPVIWAEKQLTGHKLVLSNNGSLAVSCKQVCQHSSQQCSALMSNMHGPHLVTFCNETSSVFTS